MILVIAEQRDGRLNRATWETIAGAQQIAGSSTPITVVVPGGRESSSAAKEIAAAQVKEVVTLEHDALTSYTPDGFTAALQGAIGEWSPTYVLLPHTYQTRDFAPKQKIVSLYVPEKSKKTQIIAGSPSEAAKELVKKLRDEARVL